MITGARPRGTSNASMISSGTDKSGDVLGGFARALGGRPSEIDAEVEANIEIVSRCSTPPQRGEERAFPTAVVLPLGASADEFRWFNDLGWRLIVRVTKAFLLVEDDVGFKESAVAAYEKFHRMTAAAEAYHF